MSWKSHNSWAMATTNWVPVRLWVCGLLARLGQSFISFQSQLFTVQPPFWIIWTYSWCRNYSHKDDFAFAFCWSTTARLAAQCSRWIQPIKWLLVTVTVLYCCCCVTVSWLKFQSSWGNSVAFPNAGQQDNKCERCVWVCVCVRANHTVWH